MAKDVDSKVRIASSWSISPATKFGLPPSDLLIDPLTFTIATATRTTASSACGRSKASSVSAPSCPTCSSSSAVQHLVPASIAGAPRPHSVMLDHASKRGLRRYPASLQDHAAAQDPGGRAKIAEDLIFDRRVTATILHAFIAFSRTAPRAKKRSRSAPMRSKSASRTASVGRRKQGWSKTSIRDESYSRSTSSTPISSTDEGGRRLSAGKMQLPFVLQSAETMKSAVGISRSQGTRRGPAARHDRARHGQATCTTSARTWSTSS